jgi:hypothetical protein
MKKLRPNQVQFARERLAENLALSLAIPVGVVVGLVWFLIFLTTHSSIGLHGWPSIGAAFLINNINRDVFNKILFKCIIYKFK